MTADGWRRRRDRRSCSIYASGIVLYPSHGAPPSLTAVRRPKFRSTVACVCCPRRARRRQCGVRRALPLPRPRPVSRPEAFRWNSASTKFSLSRSPSVYLTPPRPSWINSFFPRFPLSSSSVLGTWGWFSFQLPLILVLYFSLSPPSLSRVAL